ncbi:MAG: hypothetical protein F4Z31_20370 [Gemmatimonadetes bacterium]|nr:hypothetical protein [Gemmatimonadota bacterium]MYE92794.1 hypothetical protein [Gemmatimonadota bacterium]MYJ11802.1 hypothetical protein [Gemmatimonadota bacterium]
MTTRDKTPNPLMVVFYILLILGAVGLVGFVGYRLNYADQLRVREANGYCPTGTRAQVREGIEIPGHTVILVDTSNRISEEDGARAFERIEEWTRDTLRAPFLQKLSIYGLPESEHEAPSQSGRSWCIPKQGEMADVLYENPRVVEIEFATFLNRLRRILDELRDRKEADVSPIVETMASLVERNEDIDSFLLVSDMLQNSSRWSEYTGETAVPIGAMAECGRISGSGRVRDVYLFYIDRNIAIQSNDWPTDRWGACLEGIGTRMIN